MMRILYIHNYHGDGVVGGEEILLNQQLDIMRAHGHEVYECYRKNSEYLDKSAWRKVVEFRNLIWSEEAYRDIQRQIRLYKPQIMHVHNFWMTFSPSIFKAAHDMGVSTVINLNDYRLVCGNALLLRNGRPCELCIGKNPWRLILYRCYGNSLIPSIAKYLMLCNSVKNNVWINDVDAFISLTEFGRNIIAAHGIPIEKLHVVSDFRQDPLLNTKPCTPGQGAIVICRLSAEKGLYTLMKAWKDIEYPLTIVGDGPLRKELEILAPPSVRFIGFKSGAELYKLREQTAFSIFPSECYEGFGATMIESMAVGRAVVACDIGARSEAITHGINGLLYQPLNPEDLRDKILYLIHNNDILVQMGHNARDTYLCRYTAEQHYKGLSAI
jgi:glycosyltransferase involved in cell wall biosynthesis